MLAAAALAALAPASAGARIIEIGQTAQPNPPSCPTNPCQAVSRTTGYQAKVGTQRGLMTAPADGKIVAWTITLGTPGPRQIKFFNENYGGASVGRHLDPQARHQAVPPRHRRRARCRACSRTSGRPSSSRSARALNVKKGYVIGLTVPSWAPALALGMGNDTSWRASRARSALRGAGDPVRAARPRDLAQYRCLYRTARLTYTRDADHDAEARRSAERRHAQALEQRRDDLRVELRAGLVAQLGDRVARRHRLAVGARRDHRVVGVAGEDDPRGDRDRRPGEAVGVAAAVPALVLVAHDRGQVAELRACGAGSARRSRGARPSRAIRRRSAGRACGGSRSGSRACRRRAAARRGARPRRSAGGRPSSCATSVASETTCSECSCV